MLSVVKERKFIMKCERNEVQSIKTKRKIKRKKKKRLKLRKVKDKKINRI